MILTLVVPVVLVVFALMLWAILRLPFPTNIDREGDL